MANIELPKDAEGREIPLDTRVLYDEDGNAKEVQRYTYSVRQTIPRRKWDAVMLDTTCRYTSNLYITPPAPPDSWEKFEEDSQMTPSRYCERYGIEPLLGGKVCAMMADIVARARELGEAGKEDE